MCVGVCLRTNDMPGGNVTVTCITVSLELHQQGFIYNCIKDCQCKCYKTDIILIADNFNR